MIEEDTSDTASVRDSSTAGSVLDNYILGERIGQGGFGDVYKALHRRLDNTYAVIKILRPDKRDANLEKLLVREAQVLTKLKHPNIVRVIDLRPGDDGQIYLIMDYIDGGDLSALLKASPEPLPVEEVVQIIGQVADGLQYVHQQHIIHRDLKPQNILRSKDGGSIFIADFGLAKVLDNAHSQASQSSRLNRAGTPLYQAPEHWDGNAEHRSDLYSLGIITYQLLTQHLPFTGNDKDVEKGHRYQDPPPLRRFNPDLTPEIEQVVLKMLEKDPAKRYQTALDFARDLRSVLARKTLKGMRANPDSIEEVLDSIAEGRMISLSAGEYRGPFQLEKRLHLIGAGPSTILYTTTQPVLHIHVDGVQLENMVIRRTREGDDDVAIQVDESVTYRLKHVSIQGGLADGAVWKDAEWQLPIGGVDFGRIPAEKEQAREIPIEVKESCTLTVRSNLPGLAVFPTRISPGAHTLKLVFKASGSPPGTHLDGAIQLQGEQESREIRVIGQLEEPVAPPPPVTPEIEIESPQRTMVWAYTLWDEPGRRLLSTLGDEEGKKLAAQWQSNPKDQRLRRRLLDTATSLLFDLAGRKACRWLVRRLRVNENERHRDEEVWELTLAIDGPNFPAQLSDRKKTLRLECKVLRDGRGGLKVSGMFLDGQERGIANSVTLPILVRLTPSSADNSPIPVEVLAQIQQLPMKQTNTLDVDQLKGWQVLLEFQSNQIKKRQYWAGYIRHGYREDRADVIFYLNDQDVRNDAQELIPYDDFQDLVRRSRRGWLKIYSTLPIMNTKRRRRDQDIVGSVVRLDAETAGLVVKLDPKKDRRLKAGGSLPVQGYLRFEADGDILQSERHQEALNMLKQGRSINPLLGDFFFNARKARPIEAIQQLQPTDLLSGTCNSGQIAAIEAALSTRDLLLIQGPPGTGKTTVIAEICYQVALQGKRTLIASQSNLAVDNALGRIIHHPRVRALRKGNPETVEEEGRDYTEEYVVQKWLVNTANDCQTKLEKRQGNIALLHKLVGETERFTRYQALEEAWEDRQRALLKRQAEIALQISDKVTNIEREEDREENIRALQKTLSALLNGDLHQGQPMTEAALKEVFYYVFAEIAKERNLIRRINEALQVMQQAGLNPAIHGHILESLIWLKGAAHTYNANWSEGKRFIHLIDSKIAEISEKEQNLENLRKTLLEKEEQIRNLTADIDNLQMRQQRLGRKRDQLEEAMDSVNRLKSGRKDTIFKALKEYLDVELHKQLAGAYPLASPELREVFPFEIMTIIQDDADGDFLRSWYPAVKNIQGKLQRTGKELDEYNQLSKRFQYSRQSFEDMLTLYPEIRHELDAVQVDGFIFWQSDFNSLVSLMESRMKDAYEVIAKMPPGFMGVLRRGKERRLVSLCAEIRDLERAALHGRDSILPEITNSNQLLARNLAESLTNLLQQWLIEQRRKNNDIQVATDRHRNRKDVELQHIQQLLADEREVLEYEMSNAAKAVQHLADLSRNLSECIGISDALRRTAQQVSSMTTIQLPMFRAEYYPEYARWVSDIQQLEIVVNEMWRELQEASERSQQQHAQLVVELQQERDQLSGLRSEQEQWKEQAGQDQLTMQVERQWWDAFWKTIPEYLRPLEPVEGIQTLSFLETVEQQFEDWQFELDREENRAQRYDGLLTDWISDLHSVSDDDKEELQDIYIKNANVIGITCGQAPKLTWKDVRTFAEFDTVIVDEVSKATAPELLLPAIMGKKLILIGDQHQLPPMIEEKTLAQMAEELEEDSQTYRYLNQSYFKERYTEAPDALKCMLSIQYRMHPDIMVAINQFYEQPLSCGINEPDVERDHQLESALVRKNKHLIWVTTPLVFAQKSRSRTIMLKNKGSGREVFRYESAYASFEEEADGTSQVNRREVEIIEQICAEFQKIWSLKKADGVPPKEIGVITFYAAQEKLLRECLLRKKGKGSRFDALNIRIGTVDRFQGMERAVVIVSMVRNNSQRDIGFARRDERINVAFSRAQELLVIVGCRDLFCSTASSGEAVERYNHIAQVVQKRGDFIDVSSI